MQKNQKKFLNTLKSPQNLLKSPQNPLKKNSFLLKPHQNPHK